jgi:hypothetical protein
MVGTKLRADCPAIDCGTRIAYLRFMNLRAHWSLAFPLALALLGAAVTLEGCVYVSRDPGMSDDDAYRYRYADPGALPIRSVSATDD